MDKCREEFEKQRYWIGLFREAVDFDEELGQYILNGQRKLYAFHLDSFNDRWEVWQKAWQHQQVKVCSLEERVEGLQKQLIDQGQRFNDQAQRVKDLEYKNGELQKRVDAATRKWVAVTSIATTCPNQLPDEFFQKLDELHDALCGVGLEQALKGEGQ